MNLDLLKGVRVVESSAFIAAPLAGMTMAQFGAGVRRIDLIGGGIDHARTPEMPGDPSLSWTGLNKAGRSLTTDCRKPEGRDLARALLAAPGPSGGALLTDLGTPWLPQAALVGHRADLVSCTIEGNAEGSTALDDTVNAAVGAPVITASGSPQRPANHVLPAGDPAGACQPAFAITEAVLRRAAAGKGAERRLALSDVAFSTLSHPRMPAEAELLDRERPALGIDLHGAFGRDVGTADGRRVDLAAISLGQSNSPVRADTLLAAVEHLQREPGIDLSRDTIVSFVAPWCDTRTPAPIRSNFAERGMCWGPYQTVREARACHPRLSLANPIVSRADTAGVGRHLAAGDAVRGLCHARGPTQPGPVLGQHTDDVLMDVLGLSAPGVGALHNRGVVAGAAT